LGSQGALAQIVGVTQQSVSEWCIKNKAIPPRHVLKVEAATGIPKEDLRPDIYPRDVVSSTASGDDAARGGAGGGSSTPSRADRGTSDSLSGLSA
jgi:DNA-binding transcriptional regulator YdaS (Cro superfamily)